MSHTCRIQSLGKAKVFLQSKVKPLFQHLPLQYVQAEARAACVLANTWVPHRAVSTAGSQSSVNKGNTYATCVGHLHGPPHSAFRLSKGSLCLYLFYNLCFIHTQNHFFAPSLLSLTTVPLLLELCQRIPLVSSVSYKAKDQSKETTLQREGSSPQNCFHQMIC